ncbi:hypothetical protein E4J50_24990 [Escherichia coli]|nr:hypothetical protein [Escherichia coli]
MPEGKRATLTRRPLPFRLVTGVVSGVFQEVPVTALKNLLTHAHLRLPAAWRHPVVRPDSDRQLLAHPPVSAEPAGAVSGCRYGPMRENPGLQRPERSRRLCRAVACAPGIPAKNAGM